MRLIFSQANKPCPREGGQPRCQRRQLFPKPTKCKPAALPWWLCRVRSPGFPSASQKGSPAPQAPSSSKALAFFISAWLLQCPAVPAALCLAPTCIPRPVVPPRAGDRGAVPAPSTQPLPALRPRQHGRQKMSPWQPCGTLAWFAVLRAERRGWELRARPQQRLWGWQCPPPGPECPQEAVTRSGGAASGHRELSPAPRNAACALRGSWHLLSPAATTSEEPAEQWGTQELGQGGQ